VENSNELDKLRRQIDDVDELILNLLNKRANLVIKVGKTKAETKGDYYVPARERKIYERLIEINRGPLPDEAIKLIFREVISASLSLEKLLQIAYFGPPATFTHLASIKQFGSSANFIPQKDITGVFDEVERGRADYGVVPIENSNEGVVSHTLDMFINSDLKIYAEILLEISHSLLSKTGRIEDIEKIYSHPQPIAQCRSWLRNNLSHVPVLDAASTAAAAKIALDDSEAGAIAGEFAGVLYNLKVVAKNIEDNLNNFTRFLVIAKKIPEKSGNDKTSILFSIKDEPGALYKMLKPFSSRGINLTKIESRPLKKRAWEYIFFLDMEGHITDGKISEAIEEIKVNSQFLKVLGSYPKMG
jgi:chorismate mutase/prephenate dehydratase